MRLFKNKILNRTLLFAFILLLLVSLASAHSVTQSGNCGSTACTITADYYKIQLRNGTAYNMFCEASDNPTRDWFDGAIGTSSAGSIYAGAWHMHTEISATCVTTDYDDYLEVNCSNGNASNSWQFHDYYYRQIAVDTTANYRVYYYLNYAGETDMAAIEGSFLAHAPRWTDTDSPTYIYASMSNLSNSAATGQYNTTHMVVWKWNNSNSDLDYGTGTAGDYGGLSLFRGAEASVDVPVAIDVKCLPRNESASYPDNVFDVIAEFNDNTSYGDATSSVPYFNNFEDNMNKWITHYSSSNICTPTTIGSPSSTDVFKRTEVASGYYSSSNNTMFGTEYSAHSYSTLYSPVFVLNGNDIKINFTLRVKQEPNYDGTVIYYRYNKTGSFLQVLDDSTTGVYFTTPPYDTYEGYGGHGQSTTECIASAFSNQDTGLLNINLSSAQNTGTLEIMFLDYADTNTVCASAPCGVWIDDFQVSEIISATDYYFSNDGDDSTGDGSIGNPYATITKLNTLSLVSGNNVYFACGSSWRLMEDAYPTITSGNSTTDVTYSSYGTCTATNKPLFLGSVNLSDTGNWTDIGSNIWKSTYSKIETRGLGQVFVNETLTNDIPEAVTLTRDLTPDVQGDWYFNATDGKIYMYSTSNPATHYVNIEVAPDITIATDIYLWKLDSGESYVTIENLELRYGGQHGIAGSNTHYITLYNNTISYMGGGGTSTRLGNCIELSLNSEHGNVSHNFIKDCFDAGITHQSWTTNDLIYNNYIGYNIIVNCAYGIELFNAQSGGKTANITIEHNTIVDSGYGFAETQSEGNAGRSLRLAEMTADVSNITITNNLFDDSNYRLIKKNSNWLGDAPVPDYNLYYMSTTNIIEWNGTTYSALSDFVSATVYEDNGVQGAPLLENYTYIPAYSSPACTMSSTGSYIGALPCSKDLYFSNDGDDTTGDGTKLNPYATITKMNTISESAGDTFYFKKGDVWHSPEDAFISVTSGTSGNPITYTSYGTGNKPLILGSINASNTANWSDDGGNIWTTTFTYTTEMGSVIFVDDETVGTITNAYANLNTQGEHFYDSGTDELSMYSTSNPSTYYGHIEIGVETNIVSVGTNDHITFNDIEFSYGARHGIETSAPTSGSSDYIIINNCTFQYMGGAYQSGTTRYGNGIQAWGSASHHKYTNNYFNYIYDAAITPQISDGFACIMNNITTAYNTIVNARYPYEFFNKNISGSTDNIYTHHNTFVQNTDYIYRDRSSSTNVRLSRIQSAHTNFTFTNNIFYNMSYQFWEIGSDGGAQWGGEDPDLNYNYYYMNPDAAYFAEGESSVTYDNLTDLQTQEPAMEVNAYQASSSELFVSASTNDYTIVYDSPACTMSSTSSYVGALPCATVTTPKSLYVDIDDVGGTCSDSYTRVENNITHPWCGLQDGLDNITDGDTLYIREGVYNNPNSGYTLTTATDWNNTITIKAYNDEEVNITGWQDTSVLSWSESGGIYTASYSTGSDEHMYWYNNLTSAFTYDSGSSIMNSYANMADTDNPYGCFYDNTAQDEYECRLPDDPDVADNTYFSKLNQVFYIRYQTGAGVTIEDLNIMGGRFPFYVRDSANITFKDNDVLGGQISININDVTETNLSDNNVHMQRGSNWWWEDNVKGSYMESTGIKLEDGVDDSIVTNNVITGHFNGLLAYTTVDTGHFENLVVSYNLVTDSMDDAYEFEQYGNGLYLHHNNCTDSYVCSSFIPYNSSDSTTRVEYNIFNATKLNPWSKPATSYYGEAIKLSGTGTATYINFTHNTFIGRGVYFTESNVLFNTNFIDNIFYSPCDDSSQRLLDKSGEEGDSVFYDYNNYYAEAGCNYFRYYDSDSISTEYASLALAIASGRGTGWNAHSIDTDPLFVGFIPSGLICNSSSTGSYVGALECADGTLTISFVTPTADVDFSQNEFTEFTVKVCCVGGDCGNIDVSLDPKEVYGGVE